MHGTVTIEGAADLVAVSPLTVRSWVNRGYLEPVRPGAKPLLFREWDVIRCHGERRSKREHERLDALWRDLLAAERASA